MLWRLWSYYYNPASLHAFFLLLCSASLNSIENLQVASVIKGDIVESWAFWNGQWPPLYFSNYWSAGLEGYYPCVCKFRNENVSIVLILMILHNHFLGSLAGNFGELQYVSLPFGKSGSFFTSPLTSSAFFRLPCDEYNVYKSISELVSSISWPSRDLLWLLPVPEFASYQSSFQVVLIVGIPQATGNAFLELFKCSFLELKKLHYAGILF